MKLTVVVTGGSKGIGFCIVSCLLKEGFDLIVCSRHRTSQLDDLIVLYGQDRIRWFAFDLSSSDNVKKTAKEIVKATPEIYALVNCAGVAQGSTFLMTKMEDLKSTFEINYFNTLLFTQFIAKKMMRKKAGSIINIVSTAGLLCDDGTLAYGGSKAALIHATKVLAAELGNYSIRVNAVAPGIVNTEMGQHNDERAIELFERRSSIQGTIQPDDVASMVSFLICEQKSSKITSQIMRVDRGIH